MDVEFLRYQFQDGFSGVVTKNGFSIGVRHVQMAYMFVSAVVMGAIRGSIGVAVLAMTDESRRGDTYIQIHNWDRRIQGAILSAFFFGYAVLSLPAELYYKKLGGKLVVTAMLIINGSLCVAMPTIANRGGWIAVCNAMMFIGMAHAGYSSVNQSIIEKWLPPNEKKTFCFFIYGGLYLGVVIALPVSGIISQMPLGWELIYYSLAMMTLAMAVVYGVLTSSTPDEHQAIGDKEKEFIRDALMCYSKKSMPKPWKRILTSPQFWAVAVAHSASNVVFIFYLIDVPAYLKLFNFSSDDCAWYATLPFIALWIMYITTAPTLGWISNLTLVSYIFDVTNFRKLINVLGAVGVVIGLTVLSNLTPAWGHSAVIVLTVTLGSLGFQLSGFLSSYKDMSENHSGTLMMLGSAVSSAAGAVVPFITGLIVADDVVDPRKWRPVLLYLASIYLVCNLTYTVLGSNERQHWDRYGMRKSLGHYNVVIDPPPNNLEAPKGFGARHVQTLVLFISLTVAYTMRAQLSVSMVAMTSHDFGHSATDLEDNTTDTNGTVFVQRALNEANRSSIHEGLSKWNVYRRYDWNKATQEMIMFSFFVGYTSMMIPMGCIAQKYGGKKPIMVALAVNGVLSIITPWVPIFGDWIAIGACRFLQGTTQAALYPSIHTILAKWAPVSERGRLSSYVYTGSQFGTIVIFQIAGVFAGSPSLGWPATFWLCGVLSLASFGLLWRYGAASPHDHPCISVDEMTYILEGGSADVIPKKRRTPWKSILSSTAVWGLIVTQMGSTSGYVLVLTQIPTYMNFVLEVDIKKNGLFSSLPYIAMFSMGIVFGFLADYAANKKYLSIVNIRRIANTIGMVLSGLCLVGFSFITSTVPAVVMLIICLGLHSAMHVGFHINQIDLAPNFAGPIMALGNSLANLTALAVPVIVSNIIKDDMRNQRRWQIVFMIFAALQLVTNTVFVIFAKGTVQPWNFYGEENEHGTEDTSMMNTIPEKNNLIKEKDIMTNK